MADPEAGPAPSATPAAPELDRPAFAGMTRMPSTLRLDADNNAPLHATAYEKWQRVRSQAVVFLRDRKTRYDELMLRRKERIKEVIIYVCFAILFTYVALNSRSTSNAHFLVRTMHSILEEQEFPASIVPNYFTFFKDASTMEDIWTWLEYIWIDRLYPNAKYPGGARVAIFGNNIIVGRSRIRQVRVQRDQECKVPGIFESSGLECYPLYSKKVAQTTFDPDGTWMPNWIKNQGINVSTHQGTIHPPSWMYYEDNGNAAFANSVLETDYGNAGYVIEFDPMNLHQGYIDFQQAKAVGWLNNNNTRAVFAEFTVYNPNLNLFSTAVMAFEVHATAGIYSESTWRAVNLDRLLRTSSTITFALEFILYGFVLFYFYIEFRNLRRYGRKEYFSDGYNWITVFNLLIFVVVALLEAYSIATASKLLSKEEADLENYEMQGVSFFTYQVYNWNSFNALLTWIRVIKYLDIISKKTKQLAGTLGRAATGVATLGIVFIIIYFGYALAFYLAFGQDVDDFHTVAQSIFSLFRAILGEFSFKEMYRANRVLGPLLFVTYIAMIFFVLLNMFLAVIMKSYEEISIELESQPDELSAFMRRQIKRKVKTYFGDKYRKFLGLGPAVSDDSHLTEQEIIQIYNDDEETFKELGIMNWKQFVAVADVNDDNELSLEEITAFAREVMGEEPEEEGRELPYLLMKVVERTNNVIHEQKVVRNYIEKVTRGGRAGNGARPIP